MKTVVSTLLLLSSTLAQESPSVRSEKWTDQFKCTADLDSDQPSLIDETNCSAQVDINSKPCLWCDLTSLIGSGLCVTSDIKEMLGEFWDQLCASDSGSETPDSPATPPVNPMPVPVSPPLHPIPDGSLTSPPTKSPTHAPVTTPADPPAVDPNSFTGAFSCATDSSSNMITDQATCLAKADVTSTTGQMCVWCPIPLVGGGCITNSDASSISWMCKGFEEIIQAGASATTKHLRGQNIMVDGWETMDPSCLGDSNNGLDGEESCGSRNDREGNTCVWCDGAGVLGYCVSPLQKDTFASFMDCSGAGQNNMDITAIE